MTITLSVVPTHDASKATITSAEAQGLLGVDRSVITRYVAIGKLVPARKLPGKTGAYLFAEADVLALAAERRAELEAAIARIGAA